MTFTHPRISFFKQIRTRYRHLISISAKRQRRNLQRILSQLPNLLPTLPIPHKHLSITSPSSKSPHRVKSNSINRVNFHLFFIPNPMTLKTIIFSLYFRKIIKVLNSNSPLNRRNSKAFSTRHRLNSPSLIFKRTWFSHYRLM